MGDVFSILRMMLDKAFLHLMIAAPFFFFYIKIYKHEIQEKLNKKHIKIQGLNIHYKSNAYNEAAQYN